MPCCGIPLLITVLQMIGPLFTKAPAPEGAPQVHTQERRRRRTWSSDFVTCDSIWTALCPLYPLMYLLEQPSSEAVKNPVTGCCCSMCMWWCAVTEPEWGIEPTEWAFNEDAECSAAVLYACMIPCVYRARRRVIRERRIETESATCTALKSCLWPCALDQAYKEVSTAFPKATVPLIKY